MLEPRHVELFDRIVAYRPEQTALKPSKRNSIGFQPGGFVKPAPRERPPHVHKLPPSLLSIFESQNIPDMLDPASYPFHRVAVEDRIRTRYVVAVVSFLYLFGGTLGIHHGNAGSEC